MDSRLYERCQYTATGYIQSKVNYNPDGEISHTIKVSFESAKNDSVVTVNDSRNGFSKYYYNAQERLYKCEKYTDSTGVKMKSSSNYQYDNEGNFERSEIEYYYSNNAQNKQVWTWVYNKSDSTGHLLLNGNETSKTNINFDSNYVHVTYPNSLDSYRVYFDSNGDPIKEIETYGNKRRKNQDIHNYTRDANGRIVRVEVLSLNEGEYCETTTYNEAGLIDRVELLKRKSIHFCYFY